MVIVLLPEIQLISFKRRSKLHEIEKDWFHSITIYPIF